jgi:hypothetical protein
MIISLVHKVYVAGSLGEFPGASNVIPYYQPRKAFSMVHPEEAWQERQYYDYNELNRIPLANESSKSHTGTMELPPDTTETPDTNPPQRHWRSKNIKACRLLNNDAYPSVTRVSRQFLLQTKQTARTMTSTFMTARLIEAQLSPLLEETTRRLK